MEYHKNHNFPLFYEYFLILILIIYSLIFQFFRVEADKKNQPGMKYCCSREYQNMYIKSNGESRKKKFLSCRKKIITNVQMLDISKITKISLISNLKFSSSYIYLLNWNALQQPCGTRHKRRPSTNFSTCPLCLLDTKEQWWHFGKKITIKLIILNFLLLNLENLQIYFLMLSWCLREFDLSFHQNRLL